MSMRFTLVESNGVPYPVFEGENAEAWLRAAFLRDSESQMEKVKGLMRYAKQSDHHPVQWGGNEVLLDLYPDRAVITAQWIKNTDGDECEITIPLDEAE